MFENLYKVMKNYSAFPMLLASDRVKPGTLIETSWSWFGFGNTPDKFKKEEGCPWNLLGMSDESAFYAEYPNVRRDASIITGSITGKVEFGGDLALPQYGFSVTASFVEKETVKFTVDGIEVCSFNAGYADHELRLKLRELKDEDPVRWGWVNDDFLVSNSYYISNLCFEFSSDTKIDVEATYKSLENSVSGGFKLKKTSDLKLELIGTAETPFAVRGIKV